MKKEQPKRGAKPDTLKIEGMNWRDAIKKSFQKKRPAGGWPKSSKKKPD